MPIASRTTRYRVKGVRSASTLTCVQMPHDETTNDPDEPAAPGLALASCLARSQPVVAGSQKDGTKLARVFGFGLTGGGIVKILNRTTRDRRLPERVLHSGDLDWRVVRTERSVRRRQVRVPDKIETQSAFTRSSMSSRTTRFRIGVPIKFTTNCLERRRQDLGSDGVAFQLGHQGRPESIGIASIDDSVSARTCAGSAPAADFVEVLQQIVGILVHAVRAGAFQFLRPVSAGQQTDPERTGTPGRQHVPDAVTHDGGRFDPTPRRLARRGTDRALVWRTSPDRA